MTPQAKGAPGTLSVVKGRGRALTAAQREMITIFAEAARDVPSEAMLKRIGKRKRWSDREFARGFAHNTLTTLMLYHGARHGLSDQEVRALLARLMPAR